MRAISLVVILAGVAGCAGHGTGGPIVDMKGVDPYQYDSDLAECQMYADQVQVDQKVLGGAAAGAVVGGAVGAIFDGGDGAARGAGSGAVVGGGRVDAGAWAGPAMRVTGQRASMRPLRMANRVMPSSALSVPPFSVSHPSAIAAAP